MLYGRPGPEQEKIKERLLSAIEQHARSSEVRVLVDAEDQERLGFFISKGYQPWSSFYHMIAELNRAWFLPSLPEGYLLRNLRPDEEEALIRVVNVAYRGERLQPGVLARWKTEDPAFNPEWVQVAEFKGEPVAAVLARADHEYNIYYHARRGYLGPAATLPEHQGKGLGKALTEWAWGSDAVLHVNPLRGPEHGKVGPSGTRHER
ncbi:GNAT family N-acetyltransferase [Candidatus Bipolaricaulota bacterium]|nr:GNAT family N-acetyltransferase [Candidatus Bipolaricaulota bacterium]